MINNINYNNYIDNIIEIVELASSTIVLPYFRNLDDLNIESKSHETDLVTIADKKTEILISQHLKDLFPHAFIVGEEAVEENPDLLNQMSNEDLVFVIDPIDGTWNYAKGVSLFGIMISVISKGEVVYGLIYDPVNQDYIHASKNEGAWRGKSTNLYLSRINVSNEQSAHKMVGFIPYYIYGYLFGDEKRDQLISTFTDFDRVMSLRCSAHEYRMMSEGSADFNLTSNVKPWDHCAGALIHSEAGGVTRLLTGEGYSPSIRKGQLLSASNEENWQMLQRKFKFLME